MQLTFSDRKQQWLPEWMNKGREGWITKGYEATFGVDGYIYYLDYGDGSIGLYKLQIIKSHTLNMCSLLYVSHTSIQL